MILAILNHFTKLCFRTILKPHRNEIHSSSQDCFIKSCGKVVSRRIFKIHHTCTKPSKKQQNKNLLWLPSVSSLPIFARVIACWDRHVKCFKCDEFVNGFFDKIKLPNFCSDMWFWSNSNTWFLLLSLCRSFREKFFVFWE